VAEMKFSRPENPGIFIQIEIIDGEVEWLMPGSFIQIEIIDG
jgi:hypothetical protein